MDSNISDLINNTFEKKLLNIDNDFYFDGYLVNKDYFYFKNKDNVTISFYNKLKKPKSYTISVSSNSKIDDKNKYGFAKDFYLPHHLRKPEINIFLHKEHKKPLYFSISIKPLEFPNEEKEIILTQFETLLKEKNSFLLLDSFYEDLFNLGRYCIFNNVKKFTKYDIKNIQEQIDIDLLLNDAVLPLTREQQKKIKKIK